ncbi:MAG: DUF1302 domain-containing protein [Burkholderiales bacterium]|nr:MAG: DUF1302 domain-containing protein [Burkholderiales bacterium]
MTKNHRPGTRRVLALALAAAGLGVLAVPEAQAFKFDAGSVSGSFDSTISLGFRKRLESTNCGLIGNDNGGCVPVSGTLGELVFPNDPNSSNPDFNYLQSDDGNLNYKKGDFVSFALKGTHELFLKAPGGFSGLVRASWLKDFKADDTQRNALSDDAKDLAVNNWTWLDAWIAKDLSFGDRPAKIKLGNQVMSWGEDIFIYGGVNIINAIDLQRASIPGTQLKEIFKPAPMLSLNANVTDTLSFESYYQWKWNAFTFPATGTFFSTADVLGPSAVHAYVPTSIANYYLYGGRGNDPLAYGTVGDPGGRHGLGVSDLASDSNPAFGVAGVGSVAFREGVRQPKGGQFGAALRYKADALKTDFGFYYLRYHDKIPFIGFTNAGHPGNLLGVTYFEDYGAKRDLFGVSMNTTVGPVAVGAEVSYRPKDSVAIDPTVPIEGEFSVFEYPGKVARGFTTEKKWQVHLTAFYLFAPSSPLGAVMTALGAAEGYVLAEAAMAHYPSLDRSGRVPYLLTNYELPTKTSWGYVISAGLTYPNVFGSGWNLAPQIDLTHDVHGTTPNALPFVEGRKSTAFTLNFDRESRWKATLGFTRFWGGGGNNLMRDRDFAFGSVAYTF